MTSRVRLSPVLLLLVAGCYGLVDDQASPSDTTVPVATPIKARPGGDGGTVTAPASTTPAPSATAPAVPTTPVPSATVAAPVPTTPVPTATVTTPAPTATVPTTTPPAPTATVPAPAPTATTPVPPPVVKLPYRGVHLAGAEFGAPLPGREYWDYEFPTAAEVDYFTGKGMNTFRVGFMWERVQPTAYGNFASVYFNKLDALVRYATAKGAYVILEPHNFARYYDDVVGSAQVPNAVFADFWRRMALVYKTDAHVMFNLVNEPSEMPTEQWVSAANAAIAAIRLTGATNLIHVPGNAWTGAHSWNDDWYGTPNAVAMLDVVDPGNNMVFEAHQYLDYDASGESYACVSTTVGSQRLAPFIHWLRANHRKGFIGEFAGGTSATCATAIENMLVTMENASDVLVGWAWWAAGPAWDDYPFSIEPLSFTTGPMKPQLQQLLPHLGVLP